MIAVKFGTKSVHLRVLWLRALLAGAGVGVGIAGAIASRGQLAPWPSVAAFFAAAILLVAATNLPKLAESSSARPEPGSDWPAQKPTPIVGVALALLLLALASGAFRSSAPVHGTAWVLYIGAMGALLVTAISCRSESSVPHSPGIGAGEVLILSLVLLTAAIFRTHLLATVPYGAWFDEAQNTLEARKILEDVSYRPLFVSGLSQMPTLPFYFFAPFVAWIGPSVLAVRVATTIAGIGSIFFTWLLGREMYGRTIGLLAAALLAVCRWHVNFSRFGMSMVFVSLFGPLVLWLFIRALARCSVRWSIFAGIALGLGLQTYYSMRLVVPAIVLAALLPRAAGRPSIRGRLVVLGATLATTFLAYLPMLQYARAHDAEFRQRLSTVSLWHSSSLSETWSLMSSSSRARSEALEKLEESTARHARMFHMVGDGNGRHNLPGEPMLDPVTGLFFAIGLFWCFWRFWDWRSATLLGWFIGMMLAGILTLEWEAPQAARTFGVTPVIALLAAIPLSRTTFDLRRRPFRRRVLRYSFPGVLLAGAAVFNWNLYFGRQIRDPAVIASFSAAETKLAEVLAKEGAHSEVLGPPELLDSPVQKLLAPPFLHPHALEPSRDLPMPYKGRSAVLFVRGHQPETRALIESYYPGAQVETFPPPTSAPPAEPLLWIARVSREEIAKTSGWNVRASRADAKETSANFRSSELTWRWTGLSAPFRASARGALRCEWDGPYRFRLEGSGEQQLYVDGRRVLSGQGEQELSLARGLHSFLLTALVQDVSRPTQVAWRTPVSGAFAPIDADHLFADSLPVGGLQGSYFQGQDCNGTPSFRQVDQQISFYFHVLPVPRPFSICWTGGLLARTSGEYRFATRSIDRSILLIDGRIALNNITSGEQVEVAAHLEEGWHLVELRYSNESNYAQVYFYWAPPGKEFEIVPLANLRPLSPDPPTPFSRDPS